MTPRERECLEQISQKNEQAKHLYYGACDHYGMTSAKARDALLVWDAWSKALSIAQRCFGISKE